MTPRLLRLATGLTVLLFLPIALIRAQPYSDGGLHLSFLITPPRWGSSIADTPMCS